MSNFDKVKKFMETFGQEVKEKAEFPNDKITSLRYELIMEELSEFKEAINKRDIKEVADALTDILYVTYGAGHAFGINLDKCFEEVQNSNMSKLELTANQFIIKMVKCLKGQIFLNQIYLNLLHNEKKSTLDFVRYRNWNTFIYIR